MNGAGYSYKLFRHTFSPPCSTLSTSSKVNHILFSPLVSLANVLVHGNHVFRGTTSSLRLSSLKRRSSGKFTSRLCSGLAWQRVPRMLILSKRILPKEKKKKTNSVHAFLITISSLHANVSFSQSSNINSEGMQNGGNTTNRRIQSFWRIFSVKRMGMSSRKSVNLDLEKKRRKEKHRVKNETRTAFSPFIVLLSLSLSRPGFHTHPRKKPRRAQFLIQQRNYSTGKVFGARYTNRGRKFGALAMHDISLDRILDRWSLVGGRM